jgi:hypothetical protein
VDFRLTSRDEELRHEVRSWLAEQYPDGFGRAGRATTDLHDDVDWAFARDFAKRLAAKSWLAPGWPIQYGGAGMTPMQQFVLKRGLALHDAPMTGSEAAVDILGPVFVDHMTEAQKAAHLAPISSGEVDRTAWAKPWTGGGQAQLSAHYLTSRVTANPSDGLVDVPHPVDVTPPDVSATGVDRRVAAPLSHPAIGSEFVEPVRIAEPHLR